MKKYTEHVLYVYEPTGTDLSVFLPPVDLKEMLLEDFPVKIVASFLYYHVVFVYRTS